MERARTIVLLVVRIFLYLLSLLIVLGLAQSVDLSVAGVGLGPLLIGVPAAIGLTLLFLRIDRRPWSSIGLPRPGPGVLGGFAAGAVMFGLVFFALWASGLIEVSPADPARPWMIALQLLVPIATAVVEELAFRGYLFSSIGERLPAWAAAVTVGLLFGAIHLGSVSGFAMTALMMISAVAVSVLLCGLRLVTGTLWAAIGWHAAWNWVQPLLLAPPRQLLSPPERDALTRAAPSGPEVLVGQWPMVEAGLVTIAVTVLGAVVVILYGRRRGVRWREPVTQVADRAIA